VLCGEEGVEVRMFLQNSDITKNSSKTKAFTMDHVLRSRVPLAVVAASVVGWKSMSPIESADVARDITG
jgi:hypothetical protein